MTNFTINPEKTSLAIPVTLKARLTVDRAIVTRQVRGEQIGAIANQLVLTSERTLYDLMLEGANKFTRYYETKGHICLTPPEEFIVWGPYAARYAGITNNMKVGGFSDGEDPNPDAADFVIEGKFLSTYGKVTELKP